MKLRFQEPRGLDLFIKDLAEVGINKTLIENEYLLTKLAKEEHKIPESVTPKKRVLTRVYNLTAMKRWKAILKN